MNLSELEKELVGELWVENRAYAKLIDNYIVPYCDAFPFCWAGVPAATLFPIGEMPERGWNHTAADSLDKVRAADLRRDSILTARLLLRASREQDYRVPHKSPAQVAALLEEAGFRQVLELEGRWSQPSTISPVSRTT